MKRLSILCLAAAVFALAPAARAELEYLVYDLADGSTRPMAEDEDPRDEAFHEGSKILFVRDPAVSADYYIGVFEVTRAQAASLRWSGGVTGDSGEAFGASDFSQNAGSLPEGLHFPTVDEWCAYAGKPVKEATNVMGGASAFSSYSLADWYDNLQLQSLEPNAHGVFDMYGNAAEYVVEENGSAFYGGYTGSSGFSWGSAINSAINEDTAPEATRREASEISGAVLGARLVYKVPPPETYTLTVTLDGETVSETAGHLEGAEVTVTPPTPSGRALTGREVTPTGLDGGAALDKAFTFEMPAENVTVAYTSKPYATITVEGGTASVEGGQSGASVRAFAGDVVTLTAREPGEYETFAGWEGVAEGLEGNVFTVPENIQGGEEYAFSARFDVIPRATITVTGGTASVEGGESGAVVRAVAGAEVTLTPRAPGKYERFADWETPAGVALGEGDVFTVPGDIRDGQEYAFTARFELIPHATIVVVGGDASAYEAVADETVTLTPRAAPAYQAFTGWEGVAEGLAGNVFTVPALTGNVTYTFTATYQYYPRVLVSGGSAVVSNGKSFGNGYYEPGASLTLTPDDVEGRTFKRWEGAEGGLTGTAYTVGGYGTAVTLTATYEEAETETPAPATIRLGSGSSLFGNLPGDRKEVGEDAFGNVYRGFHYSPAGTIASLGLTNGTITYSEPVESGDDSVDDQPELADYDSYRAFWRDYLEWWQEAYGEAETPQLDTTVLALRRVVRGDGTAFYLGVYETTVGHVARLNGEEKNLDSEAVYCGRNGSDFWPTPDKFKAILSKLNDKFKVNARLPEVADVAEISPGYPTDSKLTGDMVVAGGTGQNPVNANAMTQDPYGFFGLWGNAFETNGDGDGFAGAVVFRRNQGNAFLTSSIQPFNTSAYAQYASLRPLIEVEEPVTLFVGSAEGPYVQVAPGEKLFPDGADTPAPTQEGKAFQGWKLGGQSIGTDYTDYKVKAEDEGKVLAATWKDVPSVRDVTVVCKGCLGPGSAVVGGTITVYPPEGYAFVEGKPVTLSGDTGVVGSGPTLGADGTVTLTLKAEALAKAATLTVTGNTAPLPTPSPGYRLRLL